MVGAPYDAAMLFTFEIFAEDIDEIGIAPFLKPITLDLTSAKLARGMIESIATRQDIPVHSVKLSSADHTVSERWFKLDGQWRCKDA